MKGEFKDLEKATELPPEQPPTVKESSKSKSIDLLFKLPSKPNNEDIIKLEKTARKITNYIKKHPYSPVSDDDGNLINPTFRDKYENVPNTENMAPFTEKVKFNEWVEVAAIKE